MSLSGFCPFDALNNRPCSARAFVEYLIDVKRMSRSGRYSAPRDAMWRPRLFLTCAGLWAGHEYPGNDENDASLSVSGSVLI